MLKCLCCSTLKSKYNLYEVEIIVLSQRELSPKEHFLAIHPIFSFHIHSYIVVLQVLLQLQIGLSGTDETIVSILSVSAIMCYL